MTDEGDVIPTASLIYQSLFYHGDSTVMFPAAKYSVTVSHQTQRQEN